VVVGKACLYSVGLGFCLRLRHQPAEGGQRRELPVGEKVIKIRQSIVGRFEISWIVRQYPSG
jgi:hypothetical protein